jgi:hypothetical protein
MDYGVFVGGVWIVACSRAVDLRRSKEGLFRSRNLESNVGNKRGSVIGGSSSAT